MVILIFCWSPLVEAVGPCLELSQRTLPRGGPYGTAARIVRSIQDLDGKIEKTPHNSRLYYRRAMNCKRLAECDRVDFGGDKEARQYNLLRALRDLETAVATGGNTGETAFQLAHTKILLGKYGDALADLNHLIEHKGFVMADAHYLRGLALESLGLNVGDIIADYQRALQIDRDHVDAHLALGHLFNSLKEHQKALRHFKKLSEMRPESRVISNLVEHTSRLFRRQDKSQENT